MRAPAFWAAVFFVAGVVLGDFWNLSTYLLASFLVLLIVLCLISLGKVSKLSSALLFFTLFVAGFWRYELATSDFPWNHISNFLNLEQRVQITGQIVGDPDIRPDRTYLTVASEEMTWKGKKFPVTGRILVKVKESSSLFNYGDEITVAGYLFSPMSKRNPGTFDYKRYLNTKGVYGQISLPAASEVKIMAPGGNFIFSRIISPARRYLLRHFNQSLAEPYNFFLAGFVLGEKRGMPEGLREKFTRTGTLHLLAVSGSNVGLVLLFAYFLAAILRFPGWLKLGFLTLVIFFFALLTNLQPSVVRASVMAFLALLAFHAQRDINFLNLVSFTILVILFFNPQALFDISFQLSFASVLAIGLLVPQMQGIYDKIFKTRPKFFYRWLILPFFISTAAILGVAPLNVYYFDNFAPIGFVSNLVIVPLVGLVMILSSLSALFSLIIPLLAKIFVAANWLTLKASLGAVDFFSSFSFSLVKIPHPHGWVFWLYPFTLLLIFLAPKYKQARVGLALSLALALTLIFLPGFLPRGPKETKVTILDVPPATAMFIHTDSNRRLLFVRESSPATYDFVETALIPFLYKKGISFLDGVIWIGPESLMVDRINQLLGELSVGQLLLGGTGIRPGLPNKLQTVFFSQEPIDWEGLKLSPVYPDNKREPSGMIFDLGEFFLVEAKLKDFGSELKTFGSVPVLGCLDYGLFREKPEGAQPNWNMSEIVISGWDFKSLKRVERNLAQKFTGQKIHWTRNTGALEISFKNGKFNFKPTIEN